MRSSRIAADPAIEEDAFYVRAAAEPTGIAPQAKRASRPHKGGESGGFTVHADVTVSAYDKDGREKLLRYAARPPFADEQFRWRDDGNIDFVMRRPAATGQRVIVLTPIQLIRRLAWLIPPPRQHQVRFSGVLAPAAKLRKYIVPPKSLAVQPMFPEFEVELPSRRNSYVSWSRLLARVYHIDAHKCVRCGGQLKVTRAVTKPDEIAAIIDNIPILPRAPPGQLSLPFAA